MKIFSEMSYICQNVNYSKLDCVFNSANVLKIELFVWWHTLRGTRVVEKLQKELPSRLNQLDEAKNVRRVWFEISRLSISSYS